MDKQSQKITDDVYLFRDMHLGGGEYGQVYKGIIKSESKIIAIKQIITKDAKFVKQQAQLWFFETMKIKHQNIVSYYGSYIKNNVVYLFIEYCKGGTLGNLIRKNGQIQTQISQLKILLLIQQLLEGMVFLNKHNIIHRDLKPENVLLDDMQRLKIGDFGTARLLVDVATTNNSHFTPLYASPEVLLHGQKNYTSNRDVWSAGLILYQMLIGKPYFQKCRDTNSLSVALQKLKNKSPIIQALPNNFCQQWVQLLNTMLVYDYKQRPYFQDILSKFQKMRVNLSKKIHKKYNSQEDDLEKSKNSQNLNNSLQKTFFGQNFSDTFKQQIIKDIVLELRSYLIFFYRKNQFMYFEFMNTLKKNSNSYILNLLKYCLLAISWAAYYNNLSKMIEQINKFKIYLPQNRIIQKKDFIKWYQTQVQIILAQFKLRFQNRQIQIFELLKREILAAIFKRLNQKEKDRIAFKQRVEKKIPNFKQILQRLKKKIDPNQNYYEYFLKLSSCSTIYVRQMDLDKLNEDDFQSYLKIRMICNIDKVFQDVNFKDSDFIFSEKQRISNFTFEEKKEYLKQYNERLDLGYNSSLIV